MRVLVTSQPGLGHLNGIISLSLALRERGHEVLAAGAPSVIAAFGRAGVAGEVLVSEPPGSDSQETLDAVPELRLAPAPQRLAHVRAHVGIRTRAFALVDALPLLVDRWEPDLLLRDETELAAWVVAEGKGLPDVSFEVSSHWPRRRWNAEVGGALTELRTHAGLATSAAGPAATLFRYLHLSNGPRSLRDPEISLPLNTIDLAPAFFEGHAGFVQLDPGLTGHAYVAFGSVYRAPADVVLSVVETLAASLGSVVAVDVRSNHSGVASHPYVPQTPAMENCAVVVCHGGRNTVLTALRHAVPVVCVPIGSDHFDVARLVVRSGAGEAASWNADEVVSSAVRVATEARYRRAAHRVAAEIASMPGPAHAIERMEAVAARV
ncbi:glycosyltransferase [Cellulomonas sp. KRMCY2]|uniref:glycosyltransferase n=1 Tax=Cellulomonas sp. KRMCY2 TaxID=1304865 RepID=UPI00045E98F0|nr:glycosyltransferase [Cellulomonas sp. KRMCY2]